MCFHKIEVVGIYVQYMLAVQYLLVRLVLLREINIMLKTEIN